MWIFVKEFFQKNPFSTRRYVRLPKIQKEHLPQYHDRDKCS